MAVRVGGIEFAIRVNAAAAVKAVKRFQASLKGNSAAAKAANNNIKALTAGMAGLTTATAAFAAAATVAANKVVDIVTGSTLLAARVQVLGTVFRQVGQNVGFTVSQLNTVEESVKKLGITTQAARQSLTQLLQANLDLARAPQLTRIAQDAAVIAGVDSSEAFNRLVVSIQRNDVRLLRNLGIVINLNTVYQKFAAQTGRTVNTLTAFEKRQLLLNEVLLRGNDIAGTYEAALGDVFKRFTSLNRKVEEASRIFGENFLPIFETVVDTTDALLTAFTSGDLSGIFQSLAVGGTAFLLVLVPLGIAAAAATAAFTALVAGLIAFGPVVLLVAAGAAVLFAELVAGAAIIASVVGGIAAAVIQTELWAKSLDDAAVEGAKLGNELANLQDSARVLDGLAKSGLRTEAALAAMRAEVEKVAEVTPKLAVALRAAADAGDFELVRRILGNELPQAALNASEVIQEAQFEQARATAQAAEALVELGFTLTEAVAIIDKSKASGEGLNGVLKIAAEEADGLGGSIFGAGEKFQEFTLGVSDAGKSLREAQKNFAELQGVIEATREAADAREFQNLTNRVEETRKAGEQAITGLQQLQTEQRKFFSEGEKQFAKFLELQKKVSAGGVGTAEEINRAAKLQIDAAVRQSEASLASAQEQIRTQVLLANRTEKLEKARVSNLIARQSKIRGIREAAKADLKSLSDQEEFFAKVLGLSTEQIEENNRALDARSTRLEFLAAGLGPELLRLQERAAASAAKNAAIEKRLSDEIVALTEQRNKTLESLEAQFAAGRITFAQIASDRQLRLDNQNISEARSRRRNALREALLDEREFALNIEREKKKQFDELLKQEEEALNKLAELRGKVNINSLDAVKRAADDQTKALREADDFIVKISQGLANEVTPGITSVERALEEFNDAIGNAQTQAQIDELNRLFPQEVARRIDAATKNLDKTRDAFKKFTDETRPKRERDDRIAQQKRFNELIDAGVPAAVAQQERDKQRLADAKKLNEEEEKLKGEKDEQERIARELKALQENVTTALQAESEIRRQVLTKTLDFEQRKLELMKLQTVELQTQLAAIQTQRGLLGDATGGMVPPGAMVPTAPTPQTITDQTRADAAGAAGRGEAFQSEFSRLRKAEEEGVALTGELATELLDLVRVAATNREDNSEVINSVLKQIRRDKKIGDQVLSGSKRL